MARGEFVIFFFWYGIESHHLGAVVKRTFGRNEHLAHNVPLTASKNEIDVMHVLNVGAKCCLNILFRIVCYGLTLVECHETTFA